MKKQDKSILDTTLSLRLTSELKEELELIAARNVRSVNSQIRYYLINAIKEDK